MAAPPSPGGRAVNPCNPSPGFQALGYLPAPMPHHNEPLSTGPQRWARVPPGLAWERPGLPTDWVRVLARHPEGLTTLPGWCWLDTPGKVRHVAEHLLEFTEEPSS
jgi:hypothetical protein